MKNFADGFLAYLHCGEYLLEVTEECDFRFSRLFLIHDCVTFITVLHTT